MRQGSRGRLSNRQNRTRRIAESERQSGWVLGAVRCTFIHGANVRQVLPALSVKDFLGGLLTLSALAEAVALVDQGSIRTDRPKVVEYVARVVVKKVLDMEKTVVPRVVRLITLHGAPTLPRSSYPNRAKLGP